MRFAQPVSLGLTAVLAVVSSASLSSHSQQVPQFRAGITLVPVEVRVVDKDGYPARDLTKANFAIREDGVTQEIAHFQAVALDGPPELVPAPRSFMFVLGRGQLNAPTKAIQALIDFVRTKTLPADRVGVVAYLKAIEFTTNHEAVAKFLETFRDSHESIEGKIARDSRGWRPTFASETLIAIETLTRREGLQVRDLSGDGGNVPRPYNDAGYVRAALEYLRSLRGDKHTIVITEQAFVNSRLHDKPAENYWITRATAAKTSLHFKLSEAEYRRSQRKVRPQALTFEATVTVKARPDFVHVVLYQFETDRRTSGQVSVQR